VGAGRTGDQFHAHPSSSRLRASGVWPSRVIRVSMMTTKPVFCEPDTEHPVHNRDPRRKLGGFPLQSSETTPAMIPGAPDWNCSLTRPRQTASTPTIRPHGQFIRKNPQGGPPAGPRPPARATNHSIQTGKGKMKTILLALLVGPERASPLLAPNAAGPTTRHARHRRPAPPALQCRVPRAPRAVRRGTRPWSAQAGGDDPRRGRLISTSCRCFPGAGHLTQKMVEPHPSCGPALAGCEKLS